MALRSRHRPECFRRGRRLVAALAACTVYLALGGCATWQVPQSADDSALRARAVSETVRGVRLSAAVLSAADSFALLGADVNATGIQPVWVEVENPTPDILWLLRAGTDPDYFSPLEVAWSFHAPFAKTRNAAIDEHFDAVQFQNPIPARSRRGGIIFTNPHPRIRVLNVDLLGRAKMIPFTLFLPDPDNPPDEDDRQTVARYAAAPGRTITSPDAFRRALERAPCCAEGASATVLGEPVNVILIGEITDIAAALVRRSFRGDRREFDNLQRLFGRPPDVVMRKAGQGGVPANWIRAWAAPFRYRDQPVFLVQTGRPIGGRFAKPDESEVLLHADVDEARNLLVQDLLYSGDVTKLGFIEAVGAAGSSASPGRPPEPRYRSDGLRAVMFFATRPVALSDVQVVDWVPLINPRGVEAAAGKLSVPH